jgi:diadenylate cyclase
LEFSTRITDLLQRLSAYPPWEVVVEFALIWIVIFSILRFVQGTRAAGALKGLLVIIIVATMVSRFVGGGESFQRLGFLYDRFLALVAIALVVIFQPELRRALIRLGETPFFRQSRSEISSMVEAIADACRFLSKAKFGALIVIERQDSLGGLVEEGTILDAQLSPRLLQTIFFPGTALHDLAVVVRGDRIHAASVQLPLAEPGDMSDSALGSRHRAAVGLTKESDAIVVVVSEETGSLRISERGRLHGPFTVAELSAQLKSRLGREPVESSDEDSDETQNVPSPAGEHAGAQRQTRQSTM